MTALRAEDYCFVVKEPDDRSVLVEVRLHDEAAKKQFLGVWQKLGQAVQKQGDLGGPPAPGWAAWKPGEWGEQQRGYEGRQKWVAWCGNNLVGILNVWPGFGSFHEPGKSVLYLEHLAAAPGNLTTDLWVRRFRRVGETLFAYAVLLSHLAGLDGRLGLHVADRDAMGFYHRLHQKCGNRLFHPEQTGVGGPTPRGAAEAGKAYLETTAAGATLWLEGYRHA